MRTFSGLGVGECGENGECNKKQIISCLCSQYAKFRIDASSDEDGGDVCVCFVRSFRMGQEQ